MASRHLTARALALLTGALLAAAPGVHAQSSGNGFLFRQPSVGLTLHGGYARANAGSDIFSFSRDNLTLGQGDFSGFDAGGAFAVRLTDRFDLSFGVDYAGRVADSEFRDWVDTDDRPIEQTTRFERVPVTASVKAYLTPRGRTIGSFAWVPSDLSPYVGVGAGTMWYRFTQQGDFVDFDTDNLEIFSDRLESSGWAPTAHALAGADLTLTPRLALTGELRYSWANAELSNSFEGFDPIDLSGSSATLGLTVRF
jgi:opacity protein-like surface antigen